MIDYLIRDLTEEDLHSPEDRSLLSYLVKSSLEEFYDVFNLKEDDLINALVAQMKDGQGELANTRLIIINNDIAGLSQGYSSKELKSRQLMSTKDLLSHTTSAGECLIKLRSFSSTIEPATTDESFYLSRFAVSEKYRGQGLGKILLLDFEEQAKRRNLSSISLHVNRNNQSAIALYNKFGLKKITTRDDQYIFLLKKIENL